MQLNSVYLYPNNLVIYTDFLDGSTDQQWTIERYRKVYQRNFKAFRGVDNRFDLQLRNGDQRATEIPPNTSLIFNLLDKDTEELLIQKTCEIISRENGRARVFITEAELNDIEKGMYEFTIHAVLSSGRKLPLYGDDNSNAYNVMEVAGDMFGEFKDSTVIDTFSIIPTTWEGTDWSDSEIVYASAPTSSPNTLHTFHVYENNYEGTVYIQASLENGSTPITWTDVATMTFPNNNVYQNVTGKYNWFRIRHIPAKNNQGTIDKVIYR